MRILTTKFCRRVILGISSIIFCLILFLTTISISNLFILDQRALDSASKIALNRIAELGEKARDFDQEAILYELGSNPNNGFYYRFDENLNEARFLDTHGENRFNGGVDRRVCFEFTEKDELRMRPHSGDYTVEEGVLKYKHDRSNFLESCQALDIDRDSIGELEARLKVKNAEKMILGWSTHATIDWFDLFKVQSVKISTIPDNRFHVYRVDVAALLKGSIKTGDPIRKLFLFPWGMPYDEVEIDYLRLISKVEKYTRSPFGVAYETKNTETRSMLYIWANAGLSYDVHIPKGETFLDFGMGKLLADDPLGFHISVGADGRHETVYSREVFDHSKWYNGSVDLSRYAGMDVEIQFSTVGSDTNVAFWSNPLIYSRPPSRLNFVIVLEDALRADRLSCYGYPHNTSPFKDALAKAGIVFLNAFSQSTYTRSSCASFMTSLYPSATGVWDVVDALDSSYLTLAEIMRSQGFATASFIQNINAGPNAGLHQGFDTMFDSETIGMRANMAYDSPELQRWIESNSKRNLFLYLHLMDPHGPYGPDDPPEKFISQVEGAFSADVDFFERDDLYDPQWLKAPSAQSRNYFYDEEIRYNDSQLEKLIKILKSKGLWEDTVVIFMADHGEYLGEHDIWGHSPPGYKQVIHVPLIVVCPQKFPMNREVQLPVQLVDLMPTILELAGIRVDRLLLAGDSLVPLLRGKAPEFWNERISISEEVRGKTKDDGVSCGSILWRDLHILTSDTISDVLAIKMQGFLTDTRKKKVSTRVLPLCGDGDKERISGIYAFDIWLQHKMARFFKEFKRQNMMIWSILTESSEEEAGFDEKSIQQLRSLGYIE